MGRTASKDLTYKQKAFCREYVVDLNATQAAVRAGYSKNGSGQTAAHLLKNPKIQKELSVQIEKRFNGAEVNGQWVINRLVELTDRCMQKEPVMIPDGNGGKMESGEWKFDSSGANSALDKLGKYHQLWKDGVNIDLGDGDREINVNVNFGGKE